SISTKRARSSPTSSAKKFAARSRTPPRRSSARSLPHSACPSDDAPAQSAQRSPAISTFPGGPPSSLRSAAASSHHFRHAARSAAGRRASSVSSLVEAKSGSLHKACNDQDQSPPLPFAFSFAHKLRSARNHSSAWFRQALRSLAERAAPSGPSPEAANRAT